MTRARLILDRVHAVSLLRDLRLLSAPPGVQSQSPNSGDQILA